MSYLVRKEKQEQTVIRRPSSDEKTEESFSDLHFCLRHEKRIVTRVHDNKFAFKSGVFAA